MTFYWFPDNTVLCNFASVASLPLLEQILRGRGRWTEAIAYEASRSALIYPDLNIIASAGWLGEPIEIDDPAEIEQIDKIRRAALGGGQHDSLKHLGEAQTLHVIRNWGDYAGSYWITDDHDAQEYARGLGITTRDTADLISEGVTEGCCTRNDGFRLLQRMQQQGRHLRVPPNQTHL